MRTLRYLGVLEKIGLKGEEADKFLETVKSMPELLGTQEKRFLISHGISVNELKEYSRYEVLDLLKSLGRNVFIAEKTKFIKDENIRRNKVKELILRLGRTKVIFNLEVKDVIGITSKFSKYRLYNETIGFGKYSKVMEEDGLRIESKCIEGEEYFLITKL